MAPRLLIVEDNPTSRTFLAVAAEALPAIVDVADSAASAIILAGEHTHDLWLFDARLPDASGTLLLARLRTQGLSTPAIAHTASRDHDTHEALLAAGFVATVAKPLAAADWRAAIRNALDSAAPARSPPPARIGDAGTRQYALPPIWDDVAALAAMNGQHAHVVALRDLFLAELPAMRATLERAFLGGDSATIRSTLHRLRASCGFVGACRLGEASARLHAAPESASARHTFLRVFDETSVSS